MTSTAYALIVAVAAFWLPALASAFFKGSAMGLGLFALVGTVGVLLAIALRAHCRGCERDERRGGPVGNLP